MSCSSVGSSTSQSPTTGVPTQVIVSGAADAVVDTMVRLSMAGINSTQSNVATAFHSEILAPAAAPLQAYLADIPFNNPMVPAHANASVGPYDGDADAMRATLAGQIAQPVRFVEQVRAMWAAGARTFVEVGPDAVLTNLLGKCLEGLPYHAVALDDKRTNGIRGLWLGLAKLAAAGVPMNLTSLWADYNVIDDPRTRRKPTPTLKINGANYGKLAVNAAPTSPARAAKTAKPTGGAARPAPHRTNGNGNGHHNGVLLIEG